MEKTTAWMLGDQLPSVYFYYVCWDIWNIPSLLREVKEYFECEKRRFPNDHCTGQRPGWPGELWWEEDTFDYHHSHLLHS